MAAVYSNLTNRCVSCFGASVNFFDDFQGQCGMSGPCGHGWVVWSQVSKCLGLKGTSGGSS